MSATTVGAGIELATVALNVAAPAITQEQKESILNAYKSRTADAQNVLNQVGKPAFPAVADARLTSLCNAAGFIRTGVSTEQCIDLRVSDLAIFCECLNLVIFLNEQIAADKS
jgi:hypothetical protein